MASCFFKYFALLPCIVFLHGCGNSSATSADDRPSIPAGDLLGPAEDGGAGLQTGDSTGEPQADSPIVGNSEHLVVIGPEGDSSLVVNDRSYPLDAALGDIWGVQGEHFNVNFTVTDGKFTIMPTSISEEIYNLLVPVEATAIIYAEMFSPGDEFSFVTYSYSPIGAESAALAGNAFFANAYVGFDIDRSGNVDEDEQLAVLGGTIEFTGILPDIELEFSVTLQNGLTAKGHYTGLFDFTNR
ncbi:hypothetical protein [Granulosicoccus antarcticus]|uniref:Uncharacterized protein n=1 Tax=Granulosicoccus antarcticus IMCC3135 TaxID=1192854 RepID=A0A2Z2P6T2_9GAMM|nr:hypothetical protein [Granulosicoccus antarcticus]ASJ76397.1 hypothetical protein IMCC3135_31750 [Granulosicoccus antarcticus IMCC3135]